MKKTEIEEFLKKIGMNFLSDEETRLILVHGVNWREFKNCLICGKPLKIHAESALIMIFCKKCHIFYKTLNFRKGLPIPDLLQMQVDYINEIKSLIKEIRDSLKTIVT